jgi:hypothetical protein
MIKSESIKNLAAALVKFQGSMGKIIKGENNPFFKSKYASLSNILDAIQGPLAEAGLSFVQLPDDGKLTTLLMHTSGEWIEASYTIRPVKDDPQGWGSAITYARRYSLGAALGLNIDDDDDGNAASQPAKKAAANKAFEMVVTTEKVVTDADLPWLSDAQFEAMKASIEAGKGDLVQAKMGGYRIKKAHREELTNLLTVTA